MARVLRCPVEWLLDPIFGQSRMVRYIFKGMSEVGAPGSHYVNPDLSSCGSRESSACPLTCHRVTITALKGCVWSSPISSFFMEGSGHNSGTVHLESSHSLDAVHLNPTPTHQVPHLHFLMPVKGVGGASLVAVANTDTFLSSTPVMYF